MNREPAGSALPSVGGPWFEDLTVGAVFANAPPVTITPGHAALHQMLLGDRLPIALDERLALQVTGGPLVAHPGLVTDLAIGQSTSVTQHVRANLFYRGLMFRRYPSIGDTLSTITTVEALRQNSSKPGRPATGMAVLRISTVDQRDRAVLDFRRCAMILLRDPTVDTGWRDEFDSIQSSDGSAEPGEAFQDWDLRAYPLVGPLSFDNLSVTDVFRVYGGDVVSGATELARLSLNIAAIHHDSRAGGGRRLVYGGHTIGLALAQLCRALPDLIGVGGWLSCDHTGPVYEGDTLRSVVSVERLEAREIGGLAYLRSRVYADDESDAGREVLDWHLVVLMR